MFSHLSSPQPARPRRECLRSAGRCAKRWPRLRRSRRSAPPCAVTMARVIDRPRPAPEVALRRSLCRSLVGSKSSGSPMPSSATVIVTWSEPTRRAVTCTVALLGLCLTALSMRLTRTCSSRSWSAQTAGRSSQSSCTRPIALIGRHARAASTINPMSHQSRCSRRMLASIADRSSRSPTSRLSRADSEVIRDKNRVWESVSHVTSGCSRLSAYPWIAVSGVRSSWLSLERNSRCSSCERRNAVASRCARSEVSRSRASWSDLEASSRSAAASALGRS